jgi:tetratricopeptide (TPR) repeat protein
MAVVLAAAGVLVAILAARYLLPRLAHRAFAGGDFAKARRRYRAVLWTSVTRRRRAAARVSIAGAYLAEGRWADGAAATDAVDGESLDPATRAGWLNNRAYAALRQGASGADAERALGQVREALKARPEVPALLHTEGIALIATGRTEEAIRVLESLWEHGELGPRLESERSADLARAWAARGETAYAADYARRARLAAPDAPWNAAADAVAPSPSDPAIDPALVDDPAA